MHTNTWWTRSAFALFAVCAGCSDDAAAEHAAGTSDAGADVTADVAADLAVDASSDVAIDAPADVAAALPTTCAEVRDAARPDGGPAPADGAYTLYLGGDASKPWQAFCRGMNGAKPSEFLAVDEARNASQQGDGVGLATTSYRRVRVDPAGPAILPLDATFTTTSDDRGQLTDTTYLPLGFARYVSATAGAGGAATSRVDLAGTPFVFTQRVTDAGYFQIRSSLGDNAAIAGSTVVIEADVSGFALTALSTAAADTVVVSPYAADVLTASPAVESVRLPIEYVAP